MKTYKFKLTQEVEVKAENILAAENILKRAHVCDVPGFSWTRSPSGNGWVCDVQFMGSMKRERLNANGSDQPPARS